MDRDGDDEGPDAPVAGAPLMGRPAAPLRERICRAIEHAGRPITRTEITGHYVHNCTVLEVHAALEAMVADGVLVDAGPEPASNRAPGDYAEGVRRLYGLAPNPDRRR